MTDPDVTEAGRRLRSRMGSEPEAVLVLGSGLGGVSARLADPTEVRFDALPGFPPAGVEGHAGRYLVGLLAGRCVLVQEGRYHAYEGLPGAVVAAPVRLAAELGVRFMLSTNSAGGADPLLEPGDLVLLGDHLNLMGRHPLTGPQREGEERFGDMSAPYDPVLQRLALDAAVRLGIPLRRGTYAAVSGPSYETAAEVRMIRGVGGDVIGMSTVPEVIVARALGLRCMAISVVTNKATGLARRSLRHEEVLERARVSGGRLEQLLVEVVSALPGSGDAQSGDTK